MKRRGKQDANGLRYLTAVEAAQLAELLARIEANVEAMFSAVLEGPAATRVDLDILMDTSSEVNSAACTVRALCYTVKRDTSDNPPF